MRLWHESLIPYLPRQQLLGQHREVVLCVVKDGKRNTQQLIMYSNMTPRF